MSRTGVLSHYMTNLSEVSAVCVPKCVVPRHKAGEGEYRGVSRDLLLP